MAEAAAYRFFGRGFIQRRSSNQRVVSRESANPISSAAKMKMKSTPPLPAAVPSTARYVPRNNPRLNAKNTGNVRQRHSGSGGGEGACLVSDAVVAAEGCDAERRRLRLLVALTIARSARCPAGGAGG